MAIISGMIACRPVIRLLVPGDEPLLEAFLARHAESSMFLRSNVRHAGLVDRGERYHGTYAACFDAGAIVSVVGHAWNGMLLLQAPVELAAVVTAATRLSHREVRGFAGPWAQVCGARAAVAITRRAALESNEDLFALTLADLHAPPGAELVRRARPEDLDTIAAFRHDYMVEALHAHPGVELRNAARGEMERAIVERTAFVLPRDGVVVSYSAFNAELPDMVQIGGVFTPKPLRGRGFARATVAGSLLDARARGVTRAILFTDRHNIAARRAYVALGFEAIGDYGLIML
jgi:uncharacterized protein